MRALLILLISIGIVSFTQAKPKLPKVKVIVVDENSNPIAGASVTLFKSQADYQKEENVAVSGITNKKGFIQFKGMEEIAYFILVKKGDLTNIGGLVQTDVLHVGAKNRFEVVIE